MLTFAGQTNNFLNMLPLQRRLRIKSTEALPKEHILLRLQVPTDEDIDIRPGQFVEIRVEDSATTFLRRPISVNFYDDEQRELYLLIHCVGDGTRRLAHLREGDEVDCVFPLGKGFCTFDDEPEPSQLRVLLVGGGVGTAPLLYYGHELRRRGISVEFLLGGRTKEDILQTQCFEETGPLHLTSEDGSVGVKGFVTHHPILAADWTHFACCGPKPMMWAVAREALRRNIPCELSLENLMACGLGACLCCVEKTRRGNLCVCKEGPVFNATELLID